MGTRICRTVSWRSWRSQVPAVFGKRDSLSCGVPMHALMSALYYLFTDMSSPVFRDIANGYWAYGAPLFSAGRTFSRVLLRENTFALNALQRMEYKMHMCDVGDLRRMVVRFYGCVNSLADCHRIPNVVHLSFLEIRQMSSWPWDKCGSCQRILICGSTCSSLQPMPPCYNCRQVGHGFTLCPFPPLCRLCLAGGHPFAQCPQRKNDGDPSAKRLRTLGTY